MNSECRKGGVCPSTQSAKLKVFYGLKVSKIADLDIFFQSYTYSVYGWWLPSRGGQLASKGGQMPPSRPLLNETLMYEKCCHKKSECLLEKPIRFCCV